MAQVTIEGSSTMKTDALGPGERRTVEVTDYTRKLVSIGAVFVVEGSLDYAKGGVVKAVDSGDSVPVALAGDNAPAPDETVPELVDSPPPVKRTRTAKEKDADGVG